MAYNATIQLYLMFAAVMIIAAVVTHLIRRSQAVSSGIAWGLIGSAIGFVAAPPLAVLAGLIPDVMVQREYFTRPFIGCISPAACLFLFVSSSTGVLGCFSAGFWFGIKRRRTHAA
jgi:hypothetical protein